MTHDTFWQLIDSTKRGCGPDRRAQVAKIAKALADVPLKDLGAFQRTVHQLMKQAYMFDLMVAAFVVNSYVSDDLFMEFRAWLILHGRKTFERVLADPDAVTRLIAKRDVRSIHCGNFPELGTRLWLDRGASVSQYVKLAGYARNPTVKQDWPESKEAFRERYPVLYKAFWNPQRIKAMHS
ncbi:MAG: hypothetical protein JWM57_1961 [Phycisphaerales bacterium]|nr:hypothetical protein [Phycisphaerales bacterium]